MPINCYAINLEKDTHRLKNLTNQFIGRENIAKLHIVPAILGTQSPKVAEIYQSKQKEMLQHYGLILTKGEIACFLSHQKALQEFINSGNEIGIILEDDAHLTPLFWNNILELTAFYQENLQNVVLNLRPHKHQKRFTIHKFEKYEIAKHFRVCAGAVGYIISRQVAKEIIQQKSILSYDKMLQRFWQTSFLNYATVPNFVDITEVESSICVNGGTPRKAHRKVSRKKIGFLQYKFLRAKITIKHDFNDIKFNIKTFGLITCLKKMLNM